MIRQLRYLFLPIGAFFIIGGFAFTEWSKVLALRSSAQKFQENSQLVVFEFTKSRFDGRRSIPTYEYDSYGITKEFSTHDQIDLPQDGRVRIGQDPDPHPSTQYWDSSRHEIVVPIDGPDSVDTIYKGMRGHDISEDYTKAALLTVAAVVAGIAGFFLQRILFKEFGRAVANR